MFLAHVTSFSSTNYYYELEATGMFLAHVTSFSSTNYYYELEATGMFLAHVTSFSSTNYYYELEATGMFLLILLKPCENSLVDKYICPFLLKRSASAAFCDMFPFLLRATHSELCQHASLAAS
jgi:hypothetical protein